MRIATDRRGADTSASSARDKGSENSTQSVEASEAPGTALPPAQPSPELLSLQRLIALRAAPEKGAVQQQAQNAAPSPFALEPIPAPPLIPGVAETGHEAGEQKQAIERRKSDFAKQTLTRLAALPDDALTQELVRLNEDAQLGAVAYYAEEPEHEQYLRPILRRLPRGNLLPAPLRSVVRSIFDYTQDTNTRTLELATTVYFKVEIGRAHEEDEKNIHFEARGLRRLFLALSSLPEPDVAGNQFLRRLGRYQIKAGKNAEGDYGSRDVGIGYNPRTLLADNRTYTTPGDPLRRVNLFDSTIRHEVGHAVDDRLKLTKKSAATLQWGQWEDYRNETSAAVAARIIRHANKALFRLPAAQLQDVLYVMTTLMDEGRRVSLRTFPWYTALSQAERDDLTKRDPSFSVVVQGLSSPWELRSPRAINGRVYHEAYEGRWVSYALEARKRQVSNYQFRAPAEWFAEAYAAYYEPDPRGLGAKLSDRDPDMKEWFDNNIKNAKDAAPQPAPQDEPAPAQARP